MDAPRIGSERAAAAAAEPRPAAAGATARGRDAFVDRLREVLAGADANQKRAAHRVEALAAGEGSTVETMLALSQAELSLRFVVELRNRALEAYREMSRLQL